MCQIGFNSLLIIISVPLRLPPSELSSGAAGQPDPVLGARRLGPGGLLLLPAQGLRPGGGPAEVCNTHTDRQTDTKCHLGV